MCVRVVSECCACVSDLRESVRVCVACLIVGALSRRA